MQWLSSSIATPNFEEGIELETAYMQLRYSSPIACYREIAAEFVLTFVKPHRATAIVRVTPHRNGVDKV